MRLVVRGALGGLVAVAASCALRSEAPLSESQLPAILAGDTALNRQAHSAEASTMAPAHEPAARAIHDTDEGSPTMDDALMHVAERVCEQLDLSRPELAAIASVKEAEGAHAAAVRLVRHLRARETPRLVYGLDYVQLLRSRASEEQRRAARGRLERALRQPLVAGSRHGNPISQVGPDVLFLGADESLCRQIGNVVLASREHWSEGSWGVTRSICELITWMMALPECPDEALVPLFGWLLDQTRAEWEWARTWNENSLGSSGHNWWLHTFLGFYQAGLYFPEFKGFEGFRAFAPTYFEREMQVLMEVDGFTRERSSGYHWGTFSHWLCLMQLAQANGIGFSPQFHERLARAAEVEWKTLAPNGDIPHLGDTRPLHRPDRSLERLRRVAAVFAMPEGKYVAESLAPGWTPPYEGLLPEGGRNLLPDYERLEARAPAGPTADTALPRSGYYFMRQDWTPASDWMCIEAGPLGSVVQSHDHTHVFSFELYSRGRPILIDNGSGPYGDSPERMWRVRSASHNVPTVDGADHIPVKDEWRWNGAVIPIVDSWLTKPAFAYFSGAHEGYRYLPEGVASSRRKVFYLRGQYWILLDRFTPETDAEHTYQLHFHISAPCRLDGDRLVTEGEGGNLLIVPVPGLGGEPALEPCPYPLEGYDNPDHLCYTRRGAGNQLFAALLVPFQGDHVPQVAVRRIDVHADGRTLSPWEATGLEIEIAGRRDVYVDQHMQWNLPWEAGGSSGEGRLFHSRCP
jgi:hypothetical protein